MYYGNALLGIFYYMITVILVTGVKEYKFYIPNIIYMSETNFPSKLN